MTDHQPVVSRFTGGLALAGHKDETDQIPIRECALPPYLVLPLRQHVGTPSVPVVGVGQHVLKGQLMARPADYISATLHAPSSGTVSAIGNASVVHAGNVDTPCITMETDGADKGVPVSGRSDALDLAPRVVEELIQRAGIIGMGGAGFPTHAKVCEGTAHEVETLIINGAECEPYITCDDRLIQERAGEIIDGARIVAHTIGAGNCIIAVEDDMQDAYEALKSGCSQFDIDLVTVPAIYPAGGEKQLIQTLTGREVPTAGLPIHIGIIVQNVATVAAVSRAVRHGEPMLSRIVTVAGAVTYPGNYEVRIGTPIGFVLKEAGYEPRPGVTVLSGGPMMGTRVGDTRAPVTKTTNCLLVQPDIESRSPRSCIRCGDCIPVCPVGLQPQALYDYSRASDFDAAQDYHLFDCIECGCCSYVCPSNLPLVHYYRYAKSAIESLDYEGYRAEQARTAFIDRASRLRQLSESVADSHRIVLPPDRAAMREEIQAAVARRRSRSNDPDE